MLKKLKVKFVLLYTASAGVIVAIALMISYSRSISQSWQQQKEKFTVLMDHVSYQLQVSIMMDNSFFSTIERDNKVVLYFEENGKSLFYTGSYLAMEERRYLLSRMKEIAFEEGILMNVFPSVSNRIRSSITKLYDQSNTCYLGQVVVLPTNTGWQSIIMIQNVDILRKKSIQSINICIIIGGTSLLALFLISSIFVEKTLKPVEESRKKQVEFIAAASHELKSPLAVIKTCASIIEVKEGKSQEFITDIQAECMRMSRLIEDLILLASAETKSWIIKKEPFALDNYLIDEYEHFCLLFLEKKQELNLVLPDSVEVQVVLDRNRLYQVLIILLDNASSYSPCESKIELQLQKDKKRIRILVIDHGIGIRDEQKQHIFERFYRGDKARNDKAHYGLGLSIAYELVKRMDGILKVQDTVGGGTTFVMEFLVK